jgi:hypothetical protein
MIDRRTFIARAAGTLAWLTLPWKTKPAPAPVHPAALMLEPEALAPFTQMQFAGRCRIQHLTDIGLNVLWDIPKAQIEIASGGLDFDTPELTLELKLEAAEGPQPFGVLQVFDDVDERKGPALICGQPVLEFSPKLADGTFGPSRPIGYVESAEIESAITLKGPTAAGTTLAIACNPFKPRRTGNLESY